jgi:hypothetical protein
VKEVHIMRASPISQIPLMLLIPLLLLPAAVPAFGDEKQPAPSGLVRSGPDG